MGFIPAEDLSDATILERPLVRVSLAKGKAIRSGGKLSS
jgi:hypothetical protein